MKLNTCTHRYKFLVITAVALLASGCGPDARLTVAQGTGPNPELPPPSSSLIPVVNIAPANRWPDGTKPKAIPGTEVVAFADDLDHPRWLYVLPNGDVLVAESNTPEHPDKSGGIVGWVESKVMAKAGAGGKSADRITLLRDTNGDGVADLRSVFLDNLHSPFGMALVGNDFYVANTDAIVRFPYATGQTRIEAPGEKLADLPAGPNNRHWTKNIIASRDRKAIFATVGSNSNIAENGMKEEQGRAVIWKFDRKSGQGELFATGLRNPNGMAWVPHPGGNDHTLWTVVNERDAIGSDLVPDYMTSVQPDGFYGWPWSYFGQHVDERVQPQEPDRVAKAIKPDYALGPHTASLGLEFSSENTLPKKLRNGMFIGQHGSWNRKPRSGYKVIFVPFENGQPSGQPVDVLSGFVNEDGEANGRPVGVVIDNKGSLLVADDVGNVVWRVSAAQGQ